MGNDPEPILPVGISAIPFDSDDRLVDIRDERLLEPTVDLRRKIQLAPNWPPVGWESPECAPRDCSADAILAWIDYRQSCLAVIEYSQRAGSWNEETERNCGTSFVRDLYRLTRVLEVAGRENAPIEPIGDFTAHSAIIEFDKVREWVRAGNATQPADARVGKPNSKPKKSTAKGGRPSDTNVAADATIQDDWQQWTATNRNGTYAQFAASKNLEEAEVRAAIDRARHRD